MRPPKSKTIAILLAALPGILGFLGIGHLYLGRIRRGLILLIGNWVLAGVSIMCYFIWAMSQMVIPPPGYPRVEPPAASDVFLAISIVLFFGLVGLWIWQIFNAKSVCQNYNKQVSDRAPRSGFEE